MPLPQSGAFLGPSDQADKRGSPDEVGGPHPRGRGARHGGHRAHAVRPRLRPLRQSPELREARRLRGGQHAGHPEERRGMGEESQRNVQRGRVQRGRHRVGSGAQ